MTTVHRTGSGVERPDFAAEMIVDRGAATLHVVGELDLDTAPTLEHALASIENQDVATVVIDLSGLAFIDASGLHLLVKALKRQRESGGEVVLRSPRPHTVRVLEMVGLTSVFRIV